VQRIAFDPAGRRLASGDLHGRIRIWSVADGLPLQSLEYHHDSITGLAWLDESRLISADDSGRLLISDVARGTVLNEVRLDGVSALALAPDRTWLVLNDAAAMHKLLLPGLQSEARRSLQAPGLAIAINHAGDRIAVSDSTGTVQLLDTALVPIVVLPRPSRDAYDLAFSPDDKVLVGGGWFRLLSWNLQTHHLYEYRTAHLGKINSVAISPGGHRWLSLGRVTDSQLLMTNAVTHQVERYFLPHALCGGQARFSPDGRYVASSSDDGAIYIYDLQATYLPIVPYREE
jgi:WD40 repeat protein